MRNTTKSGNTQGVISAQEKFSNKITKANRKITSTFDYEFLDNQMEDLVYAWISSDLINGLDSNFKSNTLSFLKDYKSLIKTIEIEEKNTQFDYLQLYKNFFDSWSLKSIKDILEHLRDAFIISETANDVGVRSRVFFVLEISTDYLRRINKIQKKSIEFASQETKLAKPKS
ncbi:MAG: hypothetical protein LCH35_08975 [Bacteroidetes bacterium]|uniref:hypothetical protein n=1 Tax=Flavobacterium sp. TaxID=239 RepID=UPI002FDAF70D|nr:hypothetical protein [Bacteroidota bacterium]